MWWGLDDWEQYAFLPDLIGPGVIESPAKALEMWLLELEAYYKIGAAYTLTCHPFLSGRPGPGPRARAADRADGRAARAVGDQLGEVARHVASLDLTPRPCPQPVLPDAAYWVARPDSPPGQTEHAPRTDKEGTDMAEAPPEPAVITDLSQTPVRDFNLWSAFALAFSDVSPIVGIYSVFFIGLLAAGPAFFWGFPVVLIGQLAVTGVFGDLVCEVAVPGQRVRVGAGAVRRPVRLVRELGL